MLDTKCIQKLWPKETNISGLKCPALDIMFMCVARLASDFSHFLLPYCLVKSYFFIYCFIYITFVGSLVIQSIICTFYDVMLMSPPFVFW